jgi:hypothetical protein
MIGERSGYGLSADERGKIHSSVFAINRLRLHRADLVFAFLETADCYGSLIELGWAHAWGKPIALRLPPDETSDELWMAAHTATALYEGNITECWAQFRADFLPGQPEGD